MIFDDKSSPNFNFDDASSFYNLIGKNETGDMDDMIDMSNPDNHPDWAKEVNQKYAVNRSPASSGLLSEDKIYEMSKLPEPLEDEIKDQENLIESYKDTWARSGQSADGTQLVPLYEKLGKLREEQKRLKQNKMSSSTSVANPSVLPNMREAFDIYKSSKNIADEEGTLPKNILNSITSNKTEVPDYLAPSSSQSTLYQTSVSAPSKMPNETTLEPVSAKRIPAKIETQAPKKDEFNKIREDANSEFDNLIEKENAERQNTLDALKAMQGDVDNLKRLQFITEGSEKLGAGIAGVMSGYKVSPQQSKIFEELAEQTRKNYEQRASVEKDDPNSAYSKGFRKFAEPFAKRIGLDEKKLANLSGTQIAAVLPQLKDIYEAQVKADAYRMQREESRADRAVKQQEINEYRKRTQDLKVEKAANSRFDAFTKDEVGRIQGADRAQALIDEIKANRLVASSNVRNLLTREVAQLAMPAGLRASVSAQQATEIDTLYGRLQDTLGKIVGHPQDSIPNAYVSQLEKEINTIKEKYRHGLKQKVSSLKRGTSDPYAHEIFEGRASEFLGSSLDTDDQEAINWAKSNPDDPRAKQILQLHGL